MDGAPINGITDIAQDAVQAVANSQNNWAAIILLIALLGILAIIFRLVSAEMKERIKRSQDRENLMRQDFEEQIRHERTTQEFMGRMNDRYDATLNRVTEAFGENSAIVRQAKEEIRRNADALNRNTQVLEKFIPTLPKRTSHKPASVAMQAAEKTVASAQDTVKQVEVSEAKENEAKNG